MPEPLRPTKKQQELLEFVSIFIAEHGYSPSYREIMVGCNYTSVATVALHIRSLIARGHIVKRGRSARSLEVVDVVVAPVQTVKFVGEVTASQEKWLVKMIDAKFDIAEASEDINQKQLDELYVLVGACKVLDMQGAASSFIPRLNNLKSQIENNK